MQDHSHTDHHHHHDGLERDLRDLRELHDQQAQRALVLKRRRALAWFAGCLLYTSDAADE